MVIHWSQAVLVAVVLSCSFSEVQSTPMQSNWKNKEADIYFLVDSSASVWILDYINMLQFVADLVSDMDIDSSATRVGMGIFSNQYKQLIPLDNGFTKEKLIEEIRKAPHLKGDTFLSRALKGLLDHGLSSSVARPGVPHITVLITDGMSRHKQLTADNATLVKKAGIFMFTVGVSSGVDRDELRDIASDPKTRYNYQVTDFDHLDSIRSHLSTRMSEVELFQSDEATCLGHLKLDTVFVFDESFLGDHYSQRIKSFITSVVNDLGMNSGSARVGVVSKTCHEGDKLLGQYATEADFIADLQHKDGPGLSQLVKRVRLEAFLPENGARFDAKQRIVLIMHPEIKKRIEILREIHRAKHTGIEVFVIYFGKEYDKSFISRIASSNQFVMHQASADDLISTDVKKEFTEKFCTDLESIDNPH